MTVYTIHEPPPRKREVTTPPERIKFVRDGFYFWAFLLGPLWMLWHRLFLVLLLYFVGVSAIQLALWAAGASAAVNFAAGFLIALLIGLEAGSLRRWTLYRWRERGIVIAPNLEMAERRFFETWRASESRPPQQSPPPLPPDMRIPSSESGVIGLFPEPQPRQ